VQHAASSEDDVIFQHALKLEQLQHLAQSPELQLMLKDERLQELMLKIESAPNRELVGHRSPAGLLARVMCAAPASVVSA
jgi:hypothetical protein